MKEPWKSYSHLWSKDRPVVVYTNTGVKASMIWLRAESAGTMMPEYTPGRTGRPICLILKFIFRRLMHSPIPRSTGDVVQITALFEEKKNASPMRSTTNPRAAMRRF